MTNKVLDIFSGKLRILWGKINAAWLDGHAAEDFFDYTDKKISEETLAKVVARGNSTNHMLLIGEGNEDENAATVRQVREVLTTARREMATKQGGIIECSTNTPATTQNKKITIDGYELTKGDIFAVTFTDGNTANSPTIAINGSAQFAVMVASGAPSGSTNFGAINAAANGIALFYFNGVHFNLFGNQDTTDNTNYVEVVASAGSQYIISTKTVDTSQGANLCFVGICEDGTIEKITATTASEATDAIIFTPQKISLRENILADHWSLVAPWIGGTTYSQQLFSRCNWGKTLWKRSIGNYYNKSKVLVTNKVVTDLAQAPLYIGGTKIDDHFTPSEFSLTLRNTSLVYKRVGFFTTIENLYWSEYQDVFTYNGESWVLWQAASEKAVPSTRKINNKPLSANIDLTATDVGATAQFGGWTNMNAIAVQGGYDLIAKKRENNERIEVYLSIHGDGATNSMQIQFDGTGDFGKKPNSGATAFDNPNGQPVHLTHAGDNTFYVNSIAALEDRYNFIMTFLK